MINKPPLLLQLLQIKIFQQELETMLNKLETTGKEDLLKVFLKVTPSIEEVEPVDKIDLENKVEEKEMLVTLKTN